MPHDQQSSTDAQSSTEAQRRTSSASADQEFLQMNSDHHLALIRLSQDEAKRDPSSEAARKAQEIARKQQEELDRMTGMLQRDFGIRYEPSVPVKWQQKEQQFDKSDGPDLGRRYYRLVIQHHQQGVRMVERELPRLQNPDLRQMAERMRSEQERQIRELEQKANAS